MNNYLVNIDDPVLNGGQKAKNDITRFLTEDGFKELNIPIVIHPEDKSLGAQIRKFKDGLITIPKAIKKIKDADNIVFQYPIYSTFIMNKLIKRFYTATFSIIFGLFLSIIPNVLNSICVIGFNAQTVISFIILIIGFGISYFLGDVKNNFIKLKGKLKGIKALVKGEKVSD